jgi:hypothetical protein
VRTEHLRENHHRARYRPPRGPKPRASRRAVTPQVRRATCVDWARRRSRTNRRYSEPFPATAGREIRFAASDGSAAGGQGHARAASNGLRTPDILRAPTKHRRQYSMPPLRRRRHGLQPDRRRALEYRASHEGATEAIMLAHGFTVEQLVELVRTGLRARRPSAWSRAARRWRSRG